MTAKKTTDAPIDDPDETDKKPVDGPDTEYVTKGELRSMFEEFFGKNAKPTDDNDDEIDLDDNKDALGVYSIRDLEKMFERQVKKISQSLSAAKPKVDEKDAPPEKDEKVREEKPVTMDVVSLVDRARTFLWGAR